jgi:hypothetical protein
MVIDGSDRENRFNPSIGLSEARKDLRLKCTAIECSAGRLAAQSCNYPPALPTTAPATCAGIERRGVPPQVSLAVARSCPLMKEPCTALKRCAGEGLRAYLGCKLAFLACPMPGEESRALHRIASRPSSLPAESSRFAPARCRRGRAPPVISHCGSEPYSRQNGIQ